MKEWKKIYKVFFEILIYFTFFVVFLFFSKSLLWSSIWTLVLYILVSFLKNFKPLKQFIERIRESPYFYRYELSLIGISIFLLTFVPLLTSYYSLNNKVGGYFPFPVLIIFNLISIPYIISITKESISILKSILIQEKTLDPQHTLFRVYFIAICFLFVINTFISLYSLAICYNGGSSIIPDGNAIQTLPQLIYYVYSMVFGNQLHYSLGINKILDLALGFFTLFFEIVIFSALAGIFVEYLRKERKT